MSFKLHSLGPKNNEIDLAIERIDYANPYDFTVPHRHTYFEFIIFENDNGGYQIIDFNKYSSEKECLYIISPNQVHLMKRLQNESGLVLQFTKNFLCQSISPFQIDWIFKLQSSPKINLTSSHYSTIHYYIKKIEFELKEKGKYSRQKITHLFGFLFFEVLSALPQDINLSNNGDPAVQFMMAAETNFQKIKSIKQYSELINVPINKLTKEVKSKFGKSPLQIIHELQIVEVKRLLIIEHLSHKEIAFKLQFDSQSSYSRFIKKMTGLTPNQLKEQTVKIAY